MIKNIWIFNHYANTPSQGPSLRHFYFALGLKKAGFAPIVFASNVSHFNGNDVKIKQGKYIIDNSEKIPFVYVKTSPYNKGNGFSRIKNMMSFFFNLLQLVKPVASRFGTPDVILASSVHPLTCVAGILIARKFSVPCVAEIRDLWPEAIFSFGKLKKESLPGKILLAGEKWIYKNADAIIFTKEGDVDYIKEMGWDKNHGGPVDLHKCHYINNGVNLQSFYQNMEENVLHDYDLEDASFKVVYAGAIRPVNNVEGIVDAAKIIKKDATDIKILIYGDGSDLERLRKRVVDEKVDNVIFKGFVEKKYIPYILSKSSVNILNYSQTKFNWGRGNSSNKLFEYMASKKPVISTVKMGYCIIDRYQCGISLSENTAECLALAILKIKNMPCEEYKKIADNAGLGAQDFDFSALTGKLIKVFESVGVTVR